MSDPGVVQHDAATVRGERGGELWVDGAGPPERAFGVALEQRVLLFHGSNGQLG